MSIEVAGLITSADSYNYGLRDFEVMEGWLVIFVKLSPGSPHQSPCWSNATSMHIQVREIVLYENIYK